MSILCPADDFVILNETSLPQDQQNQLTYKKMIESLPDDKFHELFIKLPDELKDAIYAPETGEKVDGICRRNKIEHLYDDLASGIGDVYLGILRPEDFLENFNKKLTGVNGIGQINIEINNFLLRPYEEPLEKVYKLHFVATRGQQSDKQPQIETNNADQLQSQSAETPSENAPQIAAEQDDKKPQ